MKRMTVILILFIIGMVGCGTAPSGGNVTTGSGAAQSEDEVDIRGEVTQLNRFSPEDRQGDNPDKETQDPNEPVSSDDSVKTSPLKDSLGSIMVEGKIESDTEHDKASVSVKEKTKIFKQQGEDTVPGDFADIVTGSVVEVTFTGPVAESYPVQATAGEIVILD